VPPWAGRLLRIAWAPKLMRRANGVVGAVRALIADGSSSSMALSSIESELLVDMLALRMPKGVAPAVGEDPDRPRVEMDKRRRWSFIAAVVTGPGKTPVPVPVEVELLRGKRLEKAADVTELRRGRVVSFEEPPLPELSEDITT
jgi:hypothetical protein